MSQSEEPKNQSSETQVDHTGNPIGNAGPNYILLGIGLVLLIVGLGLTFVADWYYVIPALTGLVLVGRSMV